jgi:hypothetical protein
MPFAHVVGAQTGHHERKRDRVAGNLFGGANFLEELLPTAFGKLGGPKTRRAIRLRRGRVRDARKQRQLPELRTSARALKNVAYRATNFCPFARAN